ncbi:hypothetical protein [Streptomyces cinnamoneus]|uniref:Uncharacterized protein n=1 Tax=Streptomyces cinnamoneus TaxID=53446 RepID=A0A918WEL8_STRCJ|nr:hypothetical protein [Streptomyces cinnamoneus]GHC33071.1 hypothetical protein GCM10010507_01790 [Streptomyces cinnamoneus]
MGKFFDSVFISTGTVHGGQHMHTHHEDGTTTTVSYQDGQTFTTVTDKDGNEHITYADGSTHTRYSDPLDVLDAVMRARRER